MSQVIVWKQDSGRVSIFHPDATALKSQGIHEIAKRVVPQGKPYRLLDAGDIPEDRSMRNAWTVDDADLTDGVGGVQ